MIKADLPDPLMAASVAAVFAYTFKNTFQRFNSIRADDFLLMVQSIMSIVCSKSFPNNLQISRFSHFSNKETSTACQLQLVKCKDLAAVLYLSSMHPATRGWTKGVIGKHHFGALFFI